MREIKCHNCGARLKILKNGQYECPCCDALFEENYVNIQEEINKALSELTEDKVGNLRQMLYKYTHEKYLNAKKIIEVARDIKAYLPEDFLANFYELACGNDKELLNDFINNIDTDEYYYQVGLVVEFMVHALELDNLLPLNNLIEKTYKDKDLKLYNKYSDLISNEAKNLKQGIYELDIERDVFVAYSSKDIDEVLSLVKYLEKNNLSCFVALRNLRHGSNAFNVYDEAIQKAINNSKIFLFVSSPNSRNLSCDALKKELLYVRDSDYKRAQEYQIDYTKMDKKYKMPRVQYLLGSNPKNSAADKIVNTFFDGYEWRYNKEQVLDNIVDILYGNKHEEKPKKSSLNIKPNYFEEPKEPKKAEKPKEEIKEKKIVDIKDNKGFQMDGDTLVKYTGGFAKFSIPETVKHIGAKAFSGDPFIQEVTISKQVLSVETEAFKNCQYLKYVSFLGKQTELKNNLFDGCKSLKQVVLPFCYDLKDINKNPGILTSIFGDNEELKVFVPRMFSDFSGYDLHTFICKYSPQSKKYVWESNGKYFSITNDTIYSFSTGFFSSNQIEGDIIIPRLEGVNRIGSKDIGYNKIIASFEGKKMSLIRMPDTILYIDDGAFFNSICKRIEMSPNIKEIGINAFSDAEIEEVVANKRVIKIFKKAIRKADSKPRIGKIIKVR